MSIWPLYSHNILVCTPNRYTSCSNSANKISMCHMWLRKVPRLHSPQRFFEVMSSRPYQRSDDRLEAEWQSQHQREWKSLLQHERPGMQRDCQRKRQRRAAESPFTREARLRRHWHRYRQQRENSIYFRLYYAHNNIKIIVVRSHEPHNALHSSMKYLPGL